MEEQEVTLAVVTETWFREDHQLCRDPAELVETAGLNMLTRCREAEANGVAYGGGVALVCTFKQVRIKNTDRYEMLVAAGSLPRHSRRLVVVACYVPQNYCKAIGEGAMDFILETVIEMKRRYKDPYVVVTGDFNQWRLDLGDLADVREVDVGNTRKKEREVHKLDFC